MADILVALNDRPQLTHALRKHNHRLMVCDDDRKDIIDTLCACRAQLVCMDSAADYGAWHLLRLIRSGRFCDANVPVVIVSDSHWRVQEKQFAHELGCTVVDDEISVFVDHIESSLARYSASKPSILIIEDDLETANLSKLTLESIARVDIASDGFTGVELWRQHQHDLVLLDVQLPTSCGTDVLKQIVSIEPDQAVVVFTADITDQRYKEMLAAGASDYITKPVDLNELRYRCRSALQLTSFQS